jgi:hypothetical protein
MAGASVGFAQRSKARDKRPGGLRAIDFQLLECGRRDEAGRYLMAKEKPELPACVLAAGRI